MSTSKDVTMVTPRDLALSSSLPLKDLTTPLLLAELSSSADRFGSLRPDQRARGSRSTDQEEATEGAVVATTTEVMEETTTTMTVDTAAMEAAITTITMMMDTETMADTAEEEEAEAEVEEEEEEDLRDKELRRVTFFSLVTSISNLRKTKSGTSLIPSER